MIETDGKAPPALDRFRRLALIVGVAALAFCAIGAIFDATQFFRSYLLAFIYWVAIAAGGLAILMLQHMSGGAWGLVIRRVLEAVTRTFPILAVMFLPVAVGVTRIYPWANRALVDQSPALQHKSTYLNIGFFIGRAVFYFLIWNVLSYFLNKWSLEQDRTGDRYLTRKLQVLSGPGLVLYGFTVTFASIDWVMSLDPGWYSTIFGILFMGGQGLSAMAFAITVVVLLSNYKPMSGVIQPRHLHDLGKLMLAFLMLWAYFAFSQFLLIWSGNLPEEVEWYARRLHNSWKTIALALVLLHFALPFVLLLSRDLKRNGRTISMVAIAILVMRYVDLYWMTGPEFHEGRFTISWMDLLMPFGIGGVWLWFFAGELKTRPLVPVQDPYLEEALSHSAGH
ncbi:MAG TPA: hypothetical protein VJZ26_10410 [Blastocatellia bacterium]|nr:hypothetical protein [Blastocatellia bacterium]